MTNVLSEGATGARLLLAAPDTLQLSADITISVRMRKQLDRERDKAQRAEGANWVECPDWLGARVHPHGARGGYQVLLETPDFSGRCWGQASRTGRALRRAAFALPAHAS